MRAADPLILGAGPAGCAAAITLARAGIPTLLIDRDEAQRDHLCGGFLSWTTIDRLGQLGVDAARLGAEPVVRLTLCHGGESASRQLPHPSFALSRRALDTALRAAALRAGASFTVARITAIEGCELRAAGRALPFETLFLATGKRDVRGAMRMRTASSPFIGLRLRLPAAPDLAGSIELHLFECGYAGVVRHEDGNANICLAVRREALAQAEHKPRRLLDRLGALHPRFARRIEHLSPHTPITSIGAIPYGWIAKRTSQGVFRLGDQATVIPSLAGEGIGIALDSGARAARMWLEGGPGAAVAFQQDFSQRVRAPVHAARLLSFLATHGAGRWLMARMVAAGPLPLLWADRLTRLATPPEHDSEAQPAPCARRRNC